MKISYYKNTNSLYINLNDKPGADVISLNEYVNIDVDENGQPVGIEIYQNADNFVNLQNINFENILDSEVKKIPAAS